MRIAVVGAGAIGAFVGACLARGGADVSLVARGAHLRAMRANGVRVIGPSSDFTVNCFCTDDCGEIGVVDVVVIALKAHQIHSMLDSIGRLVGPRTHVVAMQNGIPWWYFQCHGGPTDGWTLESVDPGGELARTFDPARTIGCTIYSSTEIVEPGVVKHVGGTRHPLGHPDGRPSPTLLALSEAFAAGGLKAPFDPDLRHDIWVKLIGNVAFNPTSALAQATLGQLLRDADTVALIREIMEETLAVAERLGVTIDVTIDRRLDGARKVGDHKTSMLQDLEVGRPLEIESMSGAILELAGRLDVPAPATRHIYALTKLLCSVKTEGRDAVAVSAQPGLVGVNP